MFVVSLCGAIIRCLELCDDGRWPHATTFNFNWVTRLFRRPKSIDTTLSNLKCACALYCIDYYLISYFTFWKITHTHSPRFAFSQKRIQNPNQEKKLSISFEAIHRIISFRFFFLLIFALRHMHLPMVCHRFADRILREWVWVKFGTQQ